MNVESDVVIGPYLKKLADEAGVVYTGTNGDEPGAVMELYDFAEVFPISALKGTNVNELIKTIKKYLPEQDKIYRLYKIIISSNPTISSKELFDELNTIIERKIKDENLSNDDKDIYKNAIKLLTTYMYDVEENQNTNYEHEIDTLVYNFTIKSYQFLIQDKINKIKKLELDQSDSKPIDVVKLGELTKQLSELKNNLKKFRQK